MKRGVEVSEGGAERRFLLAGVSVDDITSDEVLNAVENFLRDGASHQIMTANPLMIMAAEKDRLLRLAFDMAAIVIADSVGVQWGARLHGRRLEKISGIDLMGQLCARAAQKGWRVFLMGAAPGVADVAATTLTVRYPGLTVVGVHHGYFAPQSILESDLITLISKSQPDLLFVALSTPFQDGWICQNLDRLNAKVAMGVGGSFDVLSGRLRRAPAWMRAVGLEWFFRLMQEPRRIFRMVRLFLFPLTCLRNYPRLKGN